MHTRSPIHPTAWQFSWPEIFLIKNLRRAGIEPGQIPGVFWTLKSCLQDNPGMTRRQLNRCMDRFGWHRLIVDSHIFRLARACRQKKASSSSGSAARWTASAVQQFAHKPAMPAIQTLPLQSEPK